MPKDRDCLAGTRAPDTSALHGTIGRQPRIRAGNDPNRGCFHNLTPIFPLIKLRQIIRPHQPHKPCVRKPILQGGDGLCRVGGASCASISLTRTRDVASWHAPAPCVAMGAGPSVSTDCRCHQPPPDQTKSRKACLVNATWPACAGSKDPKQPNHLITHQTAHVYILRFSSLSATYRIPILANNPIDDCLPPKITLFRPKRSQIRSIRWQPINTSITCKVCQKPIRVAKNV